MRRIKDYLQDFAKSLNTDSARLDVELLLLSVLQKDRSWLYAHLDDVIGEQPLQTWRALVERRAQGEPLAYLTGVKEFYSLTLKVTPDVLIPRPDTECLIDWVLQHYDNRSYRVADLGTGSGAIAIALAHARPQWKIVAVDQSKPALGIAKQNAVALGVTNIDFHHGSWFEGQKKQSFDIVISNPPYIAQGDSHLLKLHYEPPAALLGGRDGLDAICILLSQAQQYLSEKGVIIIEHGYEDAEKIRQIAQKHAWCSICSHQDLSGHARFITAIKSD